MKKVVEAETIYPSKLTYEERQKLSKSLYKVHKRIFKGPNEKEFDHYVVNSPANVTKIVTIQPSFRRDDDGENPLICVYGYTFFSF